MLISQAPSRFPTWQFGKILVSVLLRVTLTQKGSTSFKTNSFEGSGESPCEAYTLYSSSTVLIQSPFFNESFDGLVILS